MNTIVDNPHSSNTFQGIYDVPEVARYLKAASYGQPLYPVKSYTLIRWIRKGLSSHDLIEIPGRNLLIDFEDVISMRVIAALRAAGVSWREITQAEKWLREKTSTQRPFATESLWTGQGEIFAEWTNRLISASKHGQMALALIRDYLIPIHGLSFSKDTSAATSWEPMNGVWLEPGIQFGAPCLRGTRILTRTISGMLEAGDSVEWLMKSFGLSPAEVDAARDWESRLQSQ